MYLYPNNRKIFVNIWDTVANPKGVIQIIHGMSEYGARYEQFAHYFNLKGYIVIANDHYGHNNSVEAYFGELPKEGFKIFAEDELFITNYINEVYKLPIHILGHSMGSFITQYLMLKDSNFINSYTLLGSNYTRNLKTYMGSKFIDFLSVFRKKKQDFFIDKLMFGNFNDRFEKRTKFDWLSKNIRNVDDYINDPNCGQIYPTLFYKSFVSAIYNLNISSEFKNISNKRNILILSGASDPVGLYSKGVLRLKSFFESNNYNVEFKLYNSLRHELLHEDEKVEVYEKILNFIDSN